MESILLELIRTVPATALQSWSGTVRLCMLMVAAAVSIALARS